MSHELMIVAGTRPELIKLAPIFWELEHKGMDYVFVWSGQHYDYEMSKVFIEELKIPEPDFDLGVGSGSHAVQTAKAMIGVEEAIREYNPNIVMALGDTNTVVAAALASVKSLKSFAHIEAGLRSWNDAMPEEINRKVADHVAQFLFTPSSLATLNVLAEGIPLSRVFFVGNTIIDALLKAIHIADELTDEFKKSVKPEKPYILATVHRQENVSNPNRLASIVKALVKLASEYAVIMPLHPRTQRILREYGLIHRLKSCKNLRVLGSLGYFEFLHLLKNSLAVLTDSGGVQEEAFTLRVPTITLRYNTERPETILYRCNVLAGVDADKIVEYTKHMIRLRDLLRSKLSNKSNPYGDGKASRKIIEVISNVSDKQVIEEPDLRKTPYITYMFKMLSDIIPDQDEILSYVAKDGKLNVNSTKAVAAYVRTRIRVEKPWESLGSL